MTRFLLIITALILAGVTAITLTADSPHHHTITPMPAPSPSTSTITHGDYTPGKAGDPGVDLPGIATATPGQVWISAGPGDNVCRAPGDCGYGDNN